jgi:hypothetical protein
MPDRASPVWNLRESGQSRSVLDSMAGADARFSEIWSAVTWLIIRNPAEVGQLVPGKKATYAVKTEDFLAIGMPEVIVVYSLVDVEGCVLEIVDILDAETGNSLAETA